MRVALTIAGLDPSGGAGLVADLRTFERLGVHGAAVATLWTVQGSRGVRSVTPLTAAEVGAALDEVLGDQDVGAAKTGALGRADVVEVVAARFSRGGRRGTGSPPHVRRRGTGSPPHVRRPPLVVDPVLLPTEGAALGDEACARAIVRSLLPVAALVTPNRAELARLSGREASTEEGARDACRALHDAGARAVLAKGGHAEGDTVVDLYFDGARFEAFAAPRRRLAGRLHGAGCVLSAAIAAGLAAGHPLEEAIARAEAHVAAAIARARPSGAAISGCSASTPGRSAPSGPHPFFRFGEASQPRRFDYTSRPSGGTSGSRVRSKEAV